MNVLSPYTLCPFWQYDFQLGFVNDLVIKDVVNKPHLQNKMAAGMIEVLICGHIVANIVTSLPASEKGKPGTVGW